MSICGVVSAIIGLILPETLDCPTREKYEDFFTDTKKTDDIRFSEKGYDNKGLETKDEQNVASV